MWNSSFKPSLKESAQRSMTGLVSMPEAPPSHTAVNRSVSSNQAGGRRHMRAEDVIQMHLLITTGGGTKTRDDPQKRSAH